MKAAFISEKAKSRFNLNFILSPITALVLMAVAETVGYFAFMPLFFIFIDNAFVTLSLELLAFAFISLAIILWARFVEKSPWLGLGIRKIGILVSSLFFTFLHLGNDAISLIPLLDLPLFAILASLVMLKTGNIWVISDIHAAWNCFQGNVFAFPVSGTQAGQAFIAVETSGPDWLSGGAFGVEGSVISLLIQAGMITWLVYKLYFTSPSNQLEL